MLLFNDMARAGLARSKAYKGVLLRLLNLGLILCAPALAFADRAPASKKSCSTTVLKLGDSESPPIRLADESGLETNADKELAEKLSKAIKSWTQKKEVIESVFSELRAQAIPQIRQKLEAAKSELASLNQRADSNRHRTIARRIAGEVLEGLDIESAIWEALKLPLKRLKSAEEDGRKTKLFETSILYLRRSLETYLGRAISDPVELQATIDNILEKDAETIQKVFEDVFKSALESKKADPSVDHYPKPDQISKRILARIPVANYDWMVSAPDLVDYRDRLPPIRQKLFDQVIGPVVTEIRTRVKASSNAEAARAVWFSNLSKAFDLAFDAADAMKLNSMRIRDLSDRVQKFVVNYQSVSNGLVLKGLMGESEQLSSSQWAVLLPIVSKVANRMNSKLTHDYLDVASRDRARPAYEQEVYGRIRNFLKNPQLKRRLSQEGPEELQNELWAAIFSELPQVDLETSGVSQAWIDAAEKFDQAKNPIYVRVAKILERRSIVWGRAFGSNESSSQQLASDRASHLASLVAPLIQSKRYNPKDDSMKVELNLWSTLSQAGVGEEVWARLPAEYRQMREELRGQIGQSYYEMLVGLTIEKILFRENAKGWSEESVKSFNERLLALLPGFQKTLKTLTPEMNPSQVQSSFRPLADNIFIYIKNYYLNGVDVVADDASTGDLWNLAVRELDQRLSVEVKKQISGVDHGKIAERISEENVGEIENSASVTPNVPVPVGQSAIESQPVSFDSKLDEVTGRLANKWKRRLMKGTISRLALDQKSPYALYAELKQQLAVLLLEEVNKDPTLKDAELAELTAITNNRFIDFLRPRTPGGRQGAKVSGIVQRAVNALHLQSGSSPDDAMIITELAKITEWNSAEMSNAIKVWRKTFERDRALGGVRVLGKDGDLTEVPLVEVLPSHTTQPAESVDETLIHEKLARARHDGIAMTFIQLATINARFELLKLKVEQMDYSGTMFSAAKQALQSALSQSNDDLRAHFLIMLSPFNAHIPSSNPTYSRVNDLSRIAKDFIRGLRSDQQIVLSKFLFAESALSRETYYRTKKRELDEIFSMWISEVPFVGNFQRFVGEAGFLFEPVSNKIPPRFVKSMLKNAGFSEGEMEALEKKFWSFQVSRPVYQSEGVALFMTQDGDTIEKSTRAMSKAHKQRYQDIVDGLMDRFKKYLDEKK